MQMASDQEWNGEALTSRGVSVALTLVRECQQEFIPLPGLCTGLGGMGWVGGCSEETAANSARCCGMMKAPMKAVSCLLSEFSTEFQGDCGTNAAELQWENAAYITDSSTGYHHYFLRCEGFIHCVPLLYWFIVRDCLRGEAWPLVDLCHLFQWRVWPRQLFYLALLCFFSYFSYAGWIWTIVEMFNWHNFFSFSWMLLF